MTPLRVPAQELVEGSRSLDEPSGRYVSRVHRKTVGDALLLVDHAAHQEADAVIESLEPEVRVLLGPVRTAALSQLRRVTVVQALGKTDKIDQIARDLTEIGAYCLVPVTTRRTVVKLAGKEAARLDRWRRVVVEAARQAGRPDTLLIEPIMPLGRALREIQADVRLLLSPTAAARLSDLSLPPACAVAVLIGPEGGFHPDEVRAAEETGWEAVALGSTVLRTETAGPAVTAALLYR